MKLDIIVPHYKEPWSVGEKFFDMLDLQRGIDFADFRVLVVNDGPENRLPDECFANRPYRAGQLDIPHGGVSAARNAGIDAAESDWIMFCDFDDMFAHVYALRDVLTLLPAEGYDMLHSRLIVEDMTDGQDRLMLSQDLARFVFTHGKVYRRQFLLENNIRFDGSMRFQEDSLFNAVIIARTPHTRIGEIKTIMPFYVWVRRGGSVTNSGRDDEAMFSHFIRNLKVTEDNRENREYEHYCGMVTRTAWDAYYMIFSKTAGTKTKRNILDIFVPWIAERMDAYGKVSDEIMAKIRAVARTELYERPVPDEPEDVKRWLDKIIAERS